MAQSAPFLSTLSRDDLVSLVLAAQLDVSPYLDILGKRSSVCLNQDSLNQDSIRYKDGEQTRTNKESVKRNKCENGFDWESVKLRNVALRVAYIGNRYSGFTANNLTATENMMDYVLLNQNRGVPGRGKTTAAEREQYWKDEARQIFKVDDFSVEEHLILAFKKTKLTPEGHLRRYNRCGRTDKGVSALGQVISLALRCKNVGMGSIDPASASETPHYERRDHSNQDTSTEEMDLDVEAFEVAKFDLGAPVWNEHDFDELDYPTILNRVLPEDIQITGWAAVPANYSSRFHCLYREYKYFFFADNLNIAAMREACLFLIFLFLNVAKDFIGSHDFRNFAKADHVNVRIMRRRIDRLDISSLKDALPSLIDINTPVAGLHTVEHPDNLMVVTIRGSSFLWHQVRCMMSVLYMIGKGQEDISVVRQMLDLEKFPLKPQVCLFKLFSSRLVFISRRFASCIV